MDDDYGYNVFIPKKTTKKRTPAGSFDILESQSWYQDYIEIRDLLVDQLESIHAELRNSAVQDVVQFVKNYQHTDELLPVITLFTGFNSPDHNSVISQLANEDMNCVMVNLNPTKISSLKSLIENIVYDFLNKVNEDFNDDEDGNILMPKSKCSLLFLTEWYLNNYGLLNNKSNRTDGYSVTTHLVIVIQDIGILPKQILNDFIKTISAFKNRLPFMLLIGVPYTLNTLEKRFTSEVYSKLAIYPFQSRPSIAFLDKVLEIFLSKNCKFHMGPRVFKVLCRSYMNYNFSVKEFVKGARLCVLEHFSQSPAHAVFCCDPENNNISDRIDELTDDDIAYILDLPSMQKYNSKCKMNKKPILTVSSPTVKDELKKLYNEFNSGVTRFNAAVQCLNLLMKSLKENTLVTPIQEIYLHVMNTDTRIKWLDTNLKYIGVSSKHSLLEALKKVAGLLKNYDDSELPKIRSEFLKFIKRIEKSELEVIQKSPSRSPIKAVRSPIKVAKSPIKLAASPIKAAKSPSKFAASPIKTSPFKTPKSALSFRIRTPGSIRSPLLSANSPSAVSSPTARRALFQEGLKFSAQKTPLRSEFSETRKELLEFLHQDFLKLYLKSLDDIPLRELFIYNDYETIERLLDPIPRTALNNALENPAAYLECECCKENTQGEILKSMPDLCIVYKLHKECGNIINLYDWFQQFRTFVDNKNFTENNINTEIYARFIQAMRELHFLGYISLPKKKSAGMEFVTKFVYF